MSHLLILCLAGILLGVTPMVTGTASNEVFPLVDTDQHFVKFYNDPKTLFAKDIVDL